MKLIDRRLREMRLVPLLLTLAAILFLSGIGVEAYIELGYWGSWPEDGHEKLRVARQLVSWRGVAALLWMLSVVTGGIAGALFVERQRQDPNWRSPWDDD